MAILGTRGYPSYYGGFETAVRRLAPFLVDRGWDVVVYGRPDGTVDGQGDPRVRRVQTRGMDTKSFSTLSFGATSAFHAAKSRVDVALVMNCANGYWLPILGARGIPTLVNVDGMEWEREKWGRLARAVFLGGARMTAWKGTELVFDAEEIARRWKLQFGREGTFIPYGGEVPPELPVPAGLRRRGYALMVARFVPENTVEEFLQAAARIAESHDVVIVGSSGYGGSLDAAASSLAARFDRVNWLGHVRDDSLLHALWAHAGAYFHGHSVGGTNPALVQAMACGAPTVARDTPFNREVLGDNAAFVAADPREIAQAVLTLLESPRDQERLSVAARMRADQLYNWADVNRRYERALRTLLKRPA